MTIYVTTEVAVELCDLDSEDLLDEVRRRELSLTNVGLNHHTWSMDDLQRAVLAGDKDAVFEIAAQLAAAYFGVPVLVPPR